MTVKLIKRNQQPSQDNKVAQQPSISQMMVTTRSWVDEFKARKASGSSEADGLRKIS